jgi:hypothetical protein
MRFFKHCITSILAVAQYLLVRTDLSGSWATDSQHSYLDRPAVSPLNLALPAEGSTPPSLPQLQTQAQARATGLLFTAPPTRRMSQPTKTCKQTDASSSPLQLLKPPGAQLDDIPFHCLFPSSHLHHLFLSCLCEYVSSTFVFPQVDFCHLFYSRDLDQTPRFYIRVTLCLTEFLTDKQPK